MYINRGAGDGCAIWENDRKKMGESAKKTNTVSFKRPAFKLPMTGTSRPARASHSHTRMAPSMTERSARKPSMSPSPMKNRRAISLENLTPEKTPSTKVVYQKPTERNRQKQPELVPTDINVEGVEFNKDAARRICQVLILNAWRKERSRVRALAHENSLTLTRVDDFKKQSAALRQLLEAEKVRMSSATSKVHELSDMLENNSAKLDDIFEQKEERETKLVDFEIKIVKLETNHESQLESFYVTKAFYDKQEQNLSRERMVIEELKKGNQQIQDTIDNDDKTITMNKETIHFMGKKIAGMEIELSKTMQNVATFNAKQEEKLDKKQKLREEISKLTREFEQSVHERDLLLQQIKITKITNEEKECCATEVEKCLQKKENDIIFLRHQLYEFELQETTQSWANQARYLARRMRPMVVYILTQRVT